MVTGLVRWFWSVAPGKPMVVRFLAVILSVPILTLAAVSIYTLVATLGRWPQAAITSSAIGRGPPIDGHLLMLLEASLPMLSPQVV